MKIWKILIQILIDTLIMIGLMCLMAHLIQVWELKIIESSLLGILTGMIIIAICYAVFIMFCER